MSDEQTGIAAFAPAAVAASFEGSSDAILTLFHRPNDPSVTFQVKREDITQVIPGGEENGYRLLQILLRPGSVIETKVEMLRGVRNLQDPTLKHLTAAAISTHSSLSV
ncbi:hypothetical protein [Mesorhizobium sp. M0859]|uniref:hypothetical protein n=1 Tax=Mesorhizobium sp. M0859 TaxID=2957014 RepID=UPI003337CD3B